jgi:hypothetical protein
MAVSKDFSEQTVTLSGMFIDMLKQTRNPIGDLKQ